MCNTVHTLDTLSSPPPPSYPISDDSQTQPVNISTTLHSTGHSLSVHLVNNNDNKLLLICVHVHLVIFSYSRLIIFNSPLVMSIGQSSPRNGVTGNSNRSSESTGTLSSIVTLRHDPWGGRGGEGRGGKESIETIAGNYTCTILSYHPV